VRETATGFGETDVLKLQDVFNRNVDRLGSSGSRYEASRHHGNRGFPSDPEGVLRATALVGVAVENPLGVLFREMLGARRDHLDEQSEDVRSQLLL